MLMNYWQFIAHEAAVLGSDGCTCVSEWHQECCYEHDLACYYGKDPRSAYARYCAGTGSYWAFAEYMSRRQADYAFARCNVEWSPRVEGKVRSWVRFLGVRLGAFCRIGVRVPKDLR